MPGIVTEYPSGNLTSPLLNIVSRLTCFTPFFSRCVPSVINATRTVYWQLPVALCHQVSRRCFYIISGVCLARDVHLRGAFAALNDTAAQCFLPRLDMYACQLLEQRRRAAVDSFRSSRPWTSARVQNPTYARHNRTSLWFTHQPISSTMKCQTTTLATTPGHNTYSL